MEIRPVVDGGLVRQLVDGQFPEWAGFSLKLVEPGGSDHVIYRLGSELAVRLPRHSGAIGQARKESYWLPRLAPHLPLAVPEPVGVGEPDLGYPWPWAVARWRPGSVATVEGLGESVEAAAELAGFLTALQGFEVPPVEAREGLGRRSLADRDAGTRAAIARVAGVFDAGALLAVWEEALAAPGWDRPPVWCHGDFHTGNLLTENGRLSAVIDFGGLGVGDPACDLMVAFTLMSAGPRAEFRAALRVDDATWARGRGCALAGGVNAYTAYAATNSHVAAQTTRQILASVAG